MSFQSRASGRNSSKHGIRWSYPNAFPRLRWQLFIRRLDTARTRWGVEHSRGFFSVSERKF